MEIVEHLSCEEICRTPSKVANRSDKLSKRSFQARPDLRTHYAGQKSTLIYPQTTDQQEYRRYCIFIKVEHRSEQNCCQTNSRRELQRTYRRCTQKCAGAEPENPSQQYTNPCVKEAHCSKHYRVGTAQDEDARQYAGTIKVARCPLHDRKKNIGENFHAQ